MADEKRSKADEAAEESRANASTIAGSSTTAAAGPAEGLEVAHPAGLEVADAPPAYEATDSGAASGAVPGAGPTVASPFNFPPDSDLPIYEPPVADATNQKPIAIPQLKPDPSIPFISVWAPSLLAHGITPEKWQPFLDTVSAFLTAKVSDRAISHAGDMAKHLTEDSKQFGQKFVNDTKNVGKGIAKSLKRGNVIGAAGGLIGGAVSLPLSFSFGLVGTVLALPANAVGAIVKKPKTPGQRAAAYAAVANEKWLHARGLHAQMMDTQELAHSMGMAATDFLRPARASDNSRPMAQLQALETFIAPLEVKENSTLELAANSIWLVLAPIVRDEKASGSGPAVTSRSGSGSVAASASASASASFSVSGSGFGSEKKN